MRELEAQIEEHLEKIERLGSLNREMQELVQQERKFNEDELNRVETDCER